jgi:hypothetical protein
MDNLSRANTGWLLGLALVCSQNKIISKNTIDNSIKSI